jgi:hypothetical protein
VPTYTHWHHTSERLQIALCVVWRFWSEAKHVLPLFWWREKREKKGDRRSETSEKASHGQLTTDDGATADHTAHSGLSQQHPRQGSQSRNRGASAERPPPVDMGGPPAPPPATPSPSTSPPEGAAGQAQQASPPFEKLASPAERDAGPDSIGAADPSSSSTATKALFGGEEDEREGRKEQPRHVRVTVLGVERPAQEQQSEESEEAQQQEEGSVLVIGIDDHSQSTEPLAAAAALPRAAPATVTQGAVEAGPVGDEEGRVGTERSYRAAHRYVPAVAGQQQQSLLFTRTRGTTLHVQWWKDEELLGLGMAELDTDISRAGGGGVDGDEAGQQSWLTLRDREGVPTLAEVCVIVQSWDPLGLATPPATPRDGQAAVAEKLELTPEEQAAEQKRLVAKQRKAARAKADAVEKQRMILEDEGLAEVERARRGVFSTADVAGLLRVMSVPPHCENPVVVAAACAGLQSLMQCHLHGPARTHYSLRLREQRGVEAVLAAMAKHADAPSVQAAGYAFLEILLYPDGPQGEWGGSERSTQEARCAMFGRPPPRSALPQLGGRPTPPPAAAGPRSTDKHAPLNGTAAGGIEERARECVASITRRSKLPASGAHFPTPKPYRPKASKYLGDGGVRPPPLALATRPRPPANHPDHLAARMFARLFLETSELAYEDEKAGQLDSQPWRSDLHGEGEEEQGGAAKSKRTSRSSKKSRSKRGGKQRQSKQKAARAALLETSDAVL